MREGVVTVALGRIGVLVKWWDRFWGAVWMVGSILIAYLTGRWFADNAAPLDLGGLRYGLIVFSGLFGLLVGAFCLSIVVIGITSGIEYLFARAGYPLRPPQAVEAIPGTVEGSIDDDPTTSVSPEAAGRAVG